MAKLTFEEHMAKAKAATHLVIIGEESVGASWARDTYSFGSLAALTYGNNVYMGGSGWINFAISICWIMWMFAKASRKAERHTMTAEQFRDLCKRFAASE